MENERKVEYVFRLVYRWWKEKQNRMKSVSCATKFKIQ